MSNTTNKESALMVAPTLINQIQCKPLAKETRKIVLIAGRESKDKWLKAESLYNIFENAWYKDDYGTFMKYIDAVKTLGKESKSTYSKMVSAYRFIMSESAQKYGFTKENMDYTSAYLLSTITDFDGFMDFIGKKDLTMMSYNNIEKLKKEFERDDVIDVSPKSTKEAESDVVGNDEEESSNDDVVVKVADDNEVTATIEKGILSFTYKKKSYIIPMKDLKQYQVKKETKEA